MSKMIGELVVIKHAEHEGLGTFEPAIRAEGWTIRELLAPEAQPADWLVARDARALVVMGGAMGVYEAARYPFLTAELELLRYRVPRDYPTLGVCLGAQLIAQASGAEVVSAGRREVGWFKVEKAVWGEVDPLLAGLDFSEPLFHWHGDTFGLPPGAVHLLTSKRFEQQGFRLGKRVYGLQFHPEVPPSELPLWLAAEPQLPYGQADGVQSRDEILEGGRQHGAALERLSAQLIRRFLILIS